MPIDTTVPIQVESLGDLLDKITNVVSAEPQIVWFRGEGSTGWDLQAGVWRKHDKAGERNLTNRFRARAGTRQASFVPDYRDWAYWLSLMQHHRLPTRLLDWSRSPLIAAFFAVQQHIYGAEVVPSDACIWMLRPHLLNETEDFEEIGDVTPPIDAVSCQSLLEPAFTARAHEPNKVIAVMAAERDLRIFVQQGCFTIHSDRTPLNKRPTPKPYLARFIIRTEWVKRLARDLDICGFRKGDIFPDLDHLADELVRR